MYSLHLTYKCAFRGNGMAAVVTSDVMLSVMGSRMLDSVHMPWVFYLYFLRIVHAHVCMCVSF